MWSKTFIAASFLAGQVYGHAEFTANAAAAAALTKSQVVRAPNPCNVQAALASPIPASATGQFNVVAQSFDAGADGATTLKTGAVDTTAVGKTFTGAVTSVSGGVAAPPSEPSTADVTLALPAGTACTGGTDGKTCLVQLTTGGGFQNCLAVTQAGGASTAAAASGAPAAADASAADASAAAATDAAASVAVASAAADTGAAAAAVATGAAAAGTAATGTAATAAKAAKKAKKGKKGKKAAKKAGAKKAKARRPMRFARDMDMEMFA